MAETVDILACGAHPDDIEIGMGERLQLTYKKGTTSLFLL